MAKVKITMAMAKKVWNNPKLRPMVVARYKTFKTYWKSCQFFNNMEESKQKEFEARTYSNLIEEMEGKPEGFKKRVIGVLKKANSRRLRIKGLSD